MFHGIRRSQAVGLAAMLLATASHAAHAAEEIGIGTCGVRLLTPDDADELPRGYRDVVVRPYSKHRLVIEAGLQHMTPLMCAAVQRVVFVNDYRYAAEDGWVLPSAADLVFINYDPLKRGFGAYPVVKAIQAFLHESAHAADFLLQSRHAERSLLEGFGGEDLYDKGEADAEQWPAGAGHLADRIVTENRLRGGFRSEWLRLHRTFQSLKLAGDFRTGEWGGGEAEANAVATQGFMSPYGATSPGEDIAEFASWMIAAPLFNQQWDGEAVPASQQPKDFACQAMQAHGGPSIPGNLAAVYTKANLLRSTGMVSKKDIERCVGTLRIAGSGEGVFVYDLDNGQPQLRRTFTSNLSARIGTHAKLGQYVFLLEASGRASFAGKEHPATVKLRLPLGPADRQIDRISWPRGVYSLQAFGADFRVEMPEVPAGTFVSLPVSPNGVPSCTLLISQASNTRIEGSVFLQKALRLYAPVPVPQTGLPMRFTFKLLKSH